jgi:hypothetical protein
LTDSQVPTGAIPDIERVMAESARAITGKHSAQRRNVSVASTDITLINKLRIPSRARAHPLASIAQSPNLSPTTACSALEDLAQSLNIPSEVVEHLEALQNCEVGQFRTGLALAREGKLRHFEALSRYQEGKLLRLWECMVGKNGRLTVDDSSNSIS